VLPAILILSFAYAINFVSREMGAACDHMDHVKTQIPYTLVVAALASVFYIVFGLI
jgi:Na+/H+ antiporter NhaC